MTRPLAVAITGGISAGKTETLRSFARHGAATVSSDEIVHHLLATDDDVRSVLVEHFGERIVGEDGRPDRARLAEIVFADRTELAFLESVLHPIVILEYLNWREQLGLLERPPKVCVTEVPLLYEVGGEVRFDRVVVVTARDDLRAARRHSPADHRETRLIPDEEKVRRADYVYVNDGTIDELDAFVAGVMDELDP